MNEILINNEEKTTSSLVNYILENISVFNEIIHTYIASPFVDRIAYVQFEKKAVISEEDTVICPHCLSQL